MIEIIYTLTLISELGLKAKIDDDLVIKEGKAEVYKVIVWPSSSTYSGKV